MTQIFLTDSAESFGQQQEQLLKRAVGLRELGFEARIVCPPRTPLHEAAQNEWLGLDTISVNPTLAVPTAIKLSHSIRKHRPLAVWCHGEYDAYLCASAVHALHGLGFLGNRPALLRIRSNQTGATRALLVNKAFDHTLVASEELRDRLLDNPYIDPARVGVLPPIVDDTELGPASQDNSSHQLSGALQEAKDQGQLFIGVWAEPGEAFDCLFLVELLSELASRPDIQARGFVCLIGGVEPSPMAETLIKQFGLQSHISWMGMSEGNNQWFEHLDLLLAPSTGNLPQKALVRAVALQVPVLTSRSAVHFFSSGLSTLVKHCPPWHQPKAQPNWLGAITQVLDASGSEGARDQINDDVLQQMGVKAHLEALLGPFKLKSLGRS
ncbi:MAG: glycosyltransferase [Limnobacter sp.]|nr:glycosyltransferase [Limnobacter sp.]